MSGMTFISLLKEYEILHNVCTCICVTGNGQGKYVAYFKFVFLVHVFFLHKPELSAGEAFLLLSKFTEFCSIVQPNCLLFHH